MVISFSKRHVIMDVCRITLKENIAVYFYSPDGASEKVSQLDINNTRGPILIPNEPVLRYCASVSELYSTIRTALVSHNANIVEIPF